MNAPRIVSLFSGYGGLEMGIQSVVGGEVIAHVEFDDAPSSILAHHYPGVPNLGDITTVDWSAFLADHPELGDLFGTYRPGVIVCGGFPCQDVSLAGLRKGLKDGTRSGLWSEFARAIDELRPELVVIENVRGLLSAEADRGLESDPTDLGDGKRGPVLRALGAVLGDLAELGYDARWVGVRAADAGAPHARFRVFVLAHPNSIGRGPQLADVRSRESDALGRAAEDANLATRGEWRVAASDEKEGRWTRPHAGGRGGASASDTTGRGRDWRPQDEVGEAVARVAPAGRRGGADAAPDAGSRDERRGVAGLVGVAQGPDQGDRDQRERDGHTAADRTPATAAWGPYSAAVERWEWRMGRRAPNPTRPDGKKGANRLNPAFVEWMMGLPDGWVTEAGLTRAQQLKALGNGVVPQQAALAVATLLEAEAVAA